MPPEAAGESSGLKPWHFVEAWQSTAAGLVPRVKNGWTLSDRAWVLLVRLGIGRDSYRISPGLYALGTPDENSPVIVSCNFKLTFDILRRELAGRSCWLLLVETYGINVWCAAGKHSFNTNEVAQRVKTSGLERVVSHRTLVLPQLAAPAVAGHKLQKLCGFRGVFGPVYIKDLGRFLESGMQADWDMRKLDFPLGQRLLVALVEIYGARKFLLWSFLACMLLAVIGPGGFSFNGILKAGLGAFASVITGFLTGVFVVPALLPRLRLRAFAAKGLVAGAVTGMIIAVPLAGTLLQALTLVAACSAFASWFAMNYTGSTPFTSLSGVDREMRIYMPVQCVLLFSAVIAWLLTSWI